MKDNVHQQGLSFCQNHKRNQCPHGKNNKNNIPFFQVCTVKPETCETLPTLSLQISVSHTNVNFASTQLHTAILQKGKWDGLFLWENRNNQGKNCTQNT